MPRITVYLNAEELAFVKSYEKGMVRGLIQDLMGSVPRPGDPETIEEAIVVQKQINESTSELSKAIAGLKDCPRCHTLIPEKSEQHGKCGWKESS